MTRILERFPSNHIPVQRPFSRRNLVPAPVSVACMQLVIESLSGESKDLGNPVFVVPADLTCGQVRSRPTRTLSFYATAWLMFVTHFVTSSSTSCEGG